MKQTIQKHGFILVATLLAGLLTNAAFAVTETFDSYTNGTPIASIGGGGIWWTGGAHSVIAGGGVNGSGGVGSETADSFIFNWQGQPFQWSAMASNDMVTIGLDFQSSPVGTFDDDRVGWTIDAGVNTSSGNQFALQLDSATGGMQCYWDTNRTVINALAGIKASTWYRFRVKYTKLTETSAAVEGTLTELDATGNPTGTPYVGTIADSSLSPYSLPASRFSSANQYPSFKNFRALVGNVDNAYFSNAPDSLEYVVVISVDGMGSEYVKPLLTAGLPNELIHFKRFMAEGAGTLNARDDADYAVTLPNHVTMMTSRGVTGTTGHNWSSNTDPGTATLESNKGSYIDSAFGVSHDAGLRTGIWSGKSKFSLFQQSYSATTGAPDTQGVDNGQDKIDYDFISSGISAGDITILFTNQMTTAPCNFAFLHYQDPDAVGHSSGWSTDPASTFAATLKAVDNAIGVILTMVENSPAMQGKTTIILTADHGGHGTTHGDTTNPLDYTIPFYVWGPGVTAGADLYDMNGTSRQEPGPTANPSYTGAQPVRNGDSANLALKVLGLTAIPGSTINAAQDLVLDGAIPAFQAPSVAINNPATGATVSTTFAIEATASDADGSVTNVFFYADSSLLAGDDASPYSYTWTGAATGAHVLKAVAWDNDGLCTTSTAVNVTVAAAASVGFTAYNDCSKGAGTNPANTTEYGSSASAASSGVLKDFDTGTALPVTLTIDSALITYNGAGGPMPNSGTEAYDTFNGKVLFDNVAWYTAVSNGFFMTATFTHLDPTKEYEFAASVNRGSSAYLDRFSKFTILDIASADNASTAGVTVNSNESVTFLTGYNTVNGFVARWTKIKCGPDGDFTVRSEDGGGSGKGYPFDGIMLREVAEGPVTPTAPNVAITSPLAGANVPANFTINATATDDGAVTNVAFYADDVRLGDDAVSPYSLVWSGATVGTHALKAVAWDDVGSSATSTVVNVTVVSPQPPTVSISSPLDGATVGTTFTIDATASDTDGTITSVFFYADGNPLGSDTVSPYSVAWSGAAVGSHELTAVAWDNDNLSTTSSVVTVTVAAAAGGGFTAYNDCSSSSGTPANTTQYRTDSTTTGLLKDFDTGTTVPVTLTLDAQNVSPDVSGGVLTTGTDAYDTFNGKVPFDDCIAYTTGAGAWYMTATFTGLDPNKQYEFVSSANRNNASYTGRFSKFTISDIDSATNASTVGVTVLSNESVSFCTGYNTVNGFVARWTKIKCGADGDFTVRVEDGAGIDVGKSYAFDGIMLRETAESASATLTGITMTGGSVALSWTDSGATVRIEHSPSLTNPKWTPVPGASGISTNSYRFNLDTGDSQGYYRLGIE